jgi:hypothetical protein
LLIVIVRSGAPLPVRRPAVRTAAERLSTGRLIC